MDSMEEKLNSVLANPDMMRQIMQMAQTLGKSPEPAGESEPIPEPSGQFTPTLDPALLQKLAAIAVERGCGRMEWWCLDWNRPSIDFYKALGAEPMDEWTVYRLTGDTLKQLASESID